MGYSPDAFAQMAMQLATYRLWGGELGATYEASQVRIFLHGRTETTRSVSQASAAFCSRMGLSPSNEDTLSRAEKVALLQAAIKSHVAYMSDAAKGKGVDRHLLGLSLSIDPNTEKTPPLLIDPLYLKAKTWRVSTSHLTHPRFVNWGFGQVVPHGVGIAYSVQRNSCIFNLTALKKWDWTEKLSYLLEEALLEMRDLHSDEGAPPQLGSKL
jgi:carnitine O-acetyltransferase